MRLEEFESRIDVGMIEESRKRIRSTFTCDFKLDLLELSLTNSGLPEKLDLSPSFSMLQLPLLPQ
ncbi:MAG: hypothetical protein OH337_00010 [Candidatus Parvarchaeota archaeon]|nr:hypothetical protein [Candidatus Haiyanarchaeum thermophilum]